MSTPLWRQLHGDRYNSVVSVANTGTLTTMRCQGLEWDQRSKDCDGSHKGLESWLRLLAATAFQPLISVMCSLFRTDSLQPWNGNYHLNFVLMVVMWVRGYGHNEGRLRWWPWQSSREERYERASLGQLQGHPRDGSHNISLVGHQQSRHNGDIIDLKRLLRLQWKICAAAVRPRGDCHNSFFGLWGSSSARGRTAATLVFSSR